MTAAPSSAAAELSGLFNIDSSNPWRIVLYTHPNIDQEDMLTVGDIAAAHGRFADWTIQADGITDGGWDRWVIEPYIEGSISE